MSDHVISITLPTYLALRSASERLGVSMRQLVETAVMEYGDIARVPVTSENLLRPYAGRKAPLTNLSRVAARYCALFGCKAWAAAYELGITEQAVRQGIASIRDRPSRIGAK